jgi:sec-independent protein translocase protein TatA
MGIGAPELILILVIALILFGPGKLPEIGRALGKGVRDFKDAMTEIQIDPDKKDPK